MMLNTSQGANSEYDKRILQGYLRSGSIRDSANDESRPKFPATMG